MRFLLILSSVLLAAATAGCGGFLPRAELDLPGSVRVQGGSHELRHALESRLDGSGARLAQEDADLVLAVRPEAFAERLLSVEPVRGRAREYQIAFQVGYSLRNAKGERVIEPGEVKVVREYRVHPGERLSRRREQAIIHDEMRRAAAAAIVRRLHATSGG